MQASGKSVKAIARELGTEEGAVQRWLSGNRREEIRDVKKTKGKG
jgi:hypothetical protein